MGTREQQDPGDRPQQAGQDLGLKMRVCKGEAAAQLCAHLRYPRGLSMKDQRPHLCHLDHVGELSEAGDGDDVMVCPALGPGRKRPMLRGEAARKGDGSPSTPSRTREGRPQGGPEVMRRSGLAWALTCRATSGKSLALSG